MYHSFIQNPLIFTLVVLPMLVATNVFGQTEVVGTVVDQNGNPVPGVNILIKGTPNGTVTDYKGNFKLPLERDGIVLFMYIGYKKYEQPIHLDGRKKLVLKVRLVEDTKKYKREQSIGIIEDPPLN